jgi:hypothetical protein
VSGKISLKCKECQRRIHDFELPLDLTDEGHPACYVSKDFHDHDEPVTPELLRGAFIRGLAADCSGSMYFECPNCNSLLKHTDEEQSLFEFGFIRFIGSRTDVSRDKLFKIEAGGEAVSTEQSALECVSCGTVSAVASNLSCGPEHPEIGWEYFECPACHAVQIPFDVTK